MNTVSITSKCPIDLDGLRSKLSSHFHFVDGGPKRLIIDKLDSRVYMYHPESEAGSDTRNHLFLDYSSEELVKSVIETIADDPQFTVENDFGCVLPGNEFVARIKGGWDWRR